MTTAPHTPQPEAATSREMHFFLAGWNGAVLNVDATEHFQKAQASAPPCVATSQAQADARDALECADCGCPETSYCCCPDSPMNTTPGTKERATAIATARREST